ncbi:MAG TPA: hypothetical protein VGI16_07345 [Candidatus Acidoferrum sp.]|jgi:hypothetical protein
MLFGYNTNVEANGIVYHVQTEDRGATKAVIDTTVHYRGQVLHRRTSGYSELLPLDGERENALKQKLDEQHRAVVAEIKAGTLKMLAPVQQPARTQPGNTSGGSATMPQAAAALPAIVLELLNARTWLTGKRATLHVSVKRRESGVGISGAVVTAQIEGAAVRSEFSGTTGGDGRVLLEFEMPALASAEAALVIAAVQGGSRSQLRFQLRSKQKDLSAK